MNPILMIVGDVSIHGIVIQKAKQLGLRVLVVAINPKAHTAKTADYFECVNTTDPDAVEEIARRYRISGSITRIEANVPTVCAVNERLNLPSQGVGIGLAVTDKYVMRQCFEHAGVNSPSYRKIENEKDLEQVADWVKKGLSCCSFIAKPTDRAASFGVAQITEFSQFDRAIEHARKHAHNGKIIVEEFVQGEDIHATGYCVEGEMVLCFISRKIVTSSFASLGHIIPLSLPKKQKAAIRKECQKALASLGIHNGPSTIDMKLDQHGKPYLIEIGARVGGTRLPELIHAHSGIDLLDASIRQAIGLDLLFPSVLSRPVCNMLLYFDRPGIIRKVCSYAHLLEKYQPFEFELNIRKDMHVSPEVRTYGYMIVQAGTAEEAQKNCMSFMRELKQCIRVEITRE